MRKKITKVLLNLIFSSFFLLGSIESAFADGSHNTGSDCMICHGGGKKGMNFGGSIYSDKNGTSIVQNVVVVITDANGSQFSMGTDNRGNFYYRTKYSVMTPPYKVAIYHYNGVQKMISTATGNCNSSGCHGPGNRIFITPTSTPSTSHNAGQNCMQPGCHDTKKVFSLGGTVYTDINGSVPLANVTLRVTDANNVTKDLTTDELGNFYHLDQNGPFVPPFKISAHYGAAEEPMGSAATGYCNISGCHDSTRRIFISSLPQILAFSPMTAYTGDHVTLVGKNFTKDSSVTIGGTPVSSVELVSSQILKVIVGKGDTGNVNLSTPYGSASMAGFTFFPTTPTITKISPPFGIAGDSITVTGNGLTRATTIKFGGIEATITKQASGEITAVLGSGTGTGITLSSPYGNTTVADFTYLQPPVITSALGQSSSQSNARFGETVTISGENFVPGAMSVHFDEWPALSVTVNSSTKITAVMGVGGNNVTVSSKAGSAQTAFGFSPNVLSVPTLHAWGNIFLGTLLFFLSWIFLRQKRKISFLNQSGRVANS